VLLRLVVLGLVLAAAPARAGSVGIVVTGDSELQGTLAKELEGWLRSHGHSVGDPLPPDAASSLLNCMVIDDESCARDIVDARAKTDSVVYSEIRKPRTKSSNATTLTIYWLVRGKEPVGMRRSCASCNAGLLRSALDEMLGTVVGASQLERGTLTVHSRPEGATVMLDNESVGITPIVRELPVGTHRIVLMKNGRKAGERAIKIHAQVAAEITVPITIADEPAHSRSNAGPAALLALGGAGVIAGAVLYITSETDDGSQPFYRETRPAGIGFAAGGLVLAGIGTWLLVRSGSDSAPVVAIDPHGGIVGWARAF